MTDIATGHENGEQTGSDYKQGSHVGGINRWFDGGFPL